MAMTRSEREHADEVIFGVTTEKYRQEDGRQGVLLVAQLQENGEYFKLFAPQAFKIQGQYVDQFLRACMMIHWYTKLIQFEYDANDGEIRPIIEFPIEDGKMTARQVRRCLSGMVQLLDEFYPTLKRALEEGVVEFPDREQSMIQHLEQLLRQLRGESGGSSSGGPPQEL